MPQRLAPGAALSVSAADFYDTRRGEVAAQILRARIGALWPGLAGQSVLGIGYPQPYMRLWRDAAYRCLAATSSHHALPRDCRAACAIEPTRLPFPDLSFDRILIIHGVEPSGHDDRLLREIWRVLKDDGRILVVAPNRIGLWGHAETTPFGHGQLYSSSQIAHLLAPAPCSTSNGGTPPSTRPPQPAPHPRRPSFWNAPDAG